MNREQRADQRHERLAMPRPQTELQPHERDEKPQRIVGECTLELRDDQAPESAPPSAQSVRLFAHKVWSLSIAPPLDKRRTKSSVPCESHCGIFSHLATGCHGIGVFVWDGCVQEEEEGMNGTRHEAGVGMMRLTLREDNEMEFLERAAQEVRRLPCVLRVRTNAVRQEIEIVFKEPAAGFLRQVNDALKSVGSEMTTSKMR